MDVLHIVLIVLVVAGIWAVVELALTIRKTRASVEDLTQQVSEISTTANQTIEQVQPIITRVDSMVADLEPSVEQVQPMLDKITTAVDVATVDLASVNDILVDVSSVTDTATNVTSTVSKAANSAVSGVAGVVGKFTAGGKSHRRRKLAEKSADKDVSEQEVLIEETEVLGESAPEAPASNQNAYFVYDADSASEAK